MNDVLTKIAIKAQVEHCVSHVRLKEFAELIVQECVNVMLNTDEQKFVVETEGWELGGANHNAWDRGILDAAATVKEHFGVEQ